MQTLKGKVALVTGSSSGIGKAVALLFAKHGANIIVNSCNNPKGGEEVLEQLNKTAGDKKHIHINCDFGKRTNAEKAFTEIKRIYGKLDILINNAGKHTTEALDEITEENFEESLSANTKSTIWCTQFASKLMKDRGWIINTSSIRGIDYVGRTILYSASKSAINSITKTTAVQLAPKVLVNAILPGYVHVPAYGDPKSEVNEQRIKNTLIKRFINVEEIAQAFLFLATQEYITGSLLVADGGESILYKRN